MIRRQGRDWRSKQNERKQFKETEEKRAKGSLGLEWHQVREDSELIQSQRHKTENFCGFGERHFVQVLKETQMTSQIRLEETFQVFNQSDHSV